MNKPTDIYHHTTYDDNKELEYHFHLNYEIIYVIDGKLDIYSNGKNVVLEEGMACIIPSFTPHKTKYCNATVRHIVFDSNYINKYISLNAIKLFPQGFGTNVLISSKTELRETMDDLINEIDIYSGMSAYIYLCKIIMVCSPISNINNLSRDNRPIIRIMNYIGINSKKKLSLDDISKDCKLTKYHICRLFKKELGITPVEYITFAKIRRAVTKLHETDYTIARISDGLSFYSPKYFTKIFKSYFDVSPTEFRKSKTFLIKERYYLKTDKN